MRPSASTRPNHDVSVVPSVKLNTSLAKTSTKLRKESSLANPFVSSELRGLMSQQTSSTTGASPADRPATQRHGSSPTGCPVERPVVIEPHIATGMHMPTDRCIEADVPNASTGPSSESSTVRALAVVQPWKRIENDPPTAAAVLTTNVGCAATGKSSHWADVSACLSNMLRHWSKSKTATCKSPLRSLAPKAALRKAAESA
mmetsp:Transcript_9237/g.29427  ORF Transcript_9237/g.29427 Transcript_9237/m.29427 type:complete len:202 (-) Transcript_9237:323-928(-)